MTPTDLQNHVNALLLVAGALGSAAVHGYQLVVKAGGLRQIWRDFLGEKKP